MNIRPFDWRDLLILHRYRGQGVFLDSAQVLTRGPVLVPAGALLSYFAPTMGVYTYLCDSNRKNACPILGQVNLTAGASYARLSFLAPESGLDSANFPALLEYISHRIGERGCSVCQATYMAAYDR
jgi:hypothetical protein